jgi:hypothetical protein
VSSPPIHGGNGPPSILRHRRDAYAINSFIFKLLRLLPFPRFALILFATLFGFLAAEFPDDAALAEFAVEAGVRAGLTVIQALLAVGDLHFLA